MTQPQRILQGWLVGGLILGTMAYALAEDLTLSTYYPSPRGVYQELRTTNDTFLAMQTGNVGIGTTTPAAKLDVAMTSGTTPGMAIHGVTGQTAPFFQLTDSSGVTLMFLDSTGKLMVGRKTSTRNQLDVDGSAAIGSGYAGLQTAPSDGLIVQGRVGIGTPNPSSSALLDLSSTTQGLLAPRMTTSQRNGIASAATGLLIYNTSTNSYEFYNGSSWNALGGGPWVSSGSDIYNTNTGNVGIGTSAPTKLLEVAGDAYMSGTIYEGGTATGNAVCRSDGTNCPMATQDSCHEVALSSVNLFTCSGGEYMAGVRAASTGLGFPYVSTIYCCK